MANSTITPNMALVVPIVGVDPGPDWANNLNASLNIIDQHNHTTGQGVAIPTAGLNINTDLPINGNNIKTVKTVNFTAQPGTLAGSSPNLGCIYVAGNELVYNDEAGHVVTITNNGSVNSGAGSITGLPSGTASATYNSGSSTFVWQSATSTPANMDGGSFIFRNISASSKGVTVRAPSALAADYNLVLPLLPANSSFVTVDNAGNMGAPINVNQGLTASNIASQSLTQGLKAVMTLGTTVAAGGIAISGNSGIFSSNSVTPIQVTNLSVTITTTGRPVQYGLQSGVAGTTCQIVNENTNLAVLYVFNGVITNPANEIYTLQINPQATLVKTQTPPAGMIDFSVNGLPGTYTYNVAVANTGGFTDVIGCVLYAFEI